MSVNNIHNMTSFIQRHNNERGFATSELYSPSSNIPSFLLFKYHTYTDMVDSLASYINGY